MLVLNTGSVRTIFLENGFTIKEGCDDLKPYVYQAANVLQLKVYEELKRLETQKLLKENPFVPYFSCTIDKCQITQPISKNDQDGFEKFEKSLKHLQQILDFAATPGTQQCFYSKVNNWTREKLYFDFLTTYNQFVEPYETINLVIEVDNQLKTLNTFIEVQKNERN